jgi:hypothetical protein
MPCPWVSPLLRDPVRSRNPAALGVQPKNWLMTGVWTTAASAAM